jgi:hypothetical protein
MEDDVAGVTMPEQFNALGHPMRHRLLFALGQAMGPSASSPPDWAATRATLPTI